MKKFERQRHIRYFSNCLRHLPQQYSSADTTRLTLVHFCVQALDILGCLPEAGTCGRIGEDVYVDREGIVAWIYGLQTLPTREAPAVGSSGDAAVAGHVGGGFKGSTYLGPLANASAGDKRPEEPNKDEQPPHPYDHSHLAMTYVAICTLVTLGDDLSRLHKRAILSTIRSLQKEDGSFVAISSNRCSGTSSSSASETGDDDCDLRFMYLAVTIWYLLTDPCATKKETGDEDNYINIPSATSYLLSCVSYDGSIGLTPGREGHGGSAFCGIAALHLMGVLEDVMAREDMRGWKKDLVRWCVMRQHSLPRQRASEKERSLLHGYCEVENNAGMQGRPNKLEDTCYSYWIGGTLHVLAESHLVDGWALREYVLTCQSPYGGFGKVLGAMPDLLHSFYSLAWLALSGEQGCCDEEDRRSAEGDSVETVGDDSDVRQQVVESLESLSKFDCALGICAKRRPAF